MDAAKAGKRGSSDGSNDSKSAFNRYVRADIRDFRQKKEIGRGRNAIIYAATCVATGQKVAIKANLKQYLQAIDLHRVKREIAVIKLLRHNNIVRWLGDFEDDVCIYLVQELAARGDLFDELHHRCAGHMSEARVVRQVVVPLISALQHMHERGVIHRDLKPENILVAADSRIMVCDFGLAINTKTERPASRLGTLQYMAPEVVTRPAIRPSNMNLVTAYDEKVDIWACGVLVYELIVGIPPFESEHDDMTKQRICHMELLVDELPSYMSQSCKSFIQEVLQKEPAQRLTLAGMRKHTFVLELAPLDGVRAISRTKEGMVKRKPHVATRVTPLVTRHDKLMLFRNSVIDRLSPGPRPGSPKQQVGNASPESMPEPQEEARIPLILQTSPEAAAVELGEPEEASIMGAESADNAAGRSKGRKSWGWIARVLASFKKSTRKSRRPPVM